MNFFSPIYRTQAQCKKCNFHYVNKLILITCLFSYPPALISQQLSLFQHPAYQVELWFPQDFPQLEAQYALLCVLEGGRYGQLAASIAQELHKQGRGLPLIVAGISPKSQEAYFPELNYHPAYRPANSKAEPLWEWLETTFFPGLAAEYPLAPYRILAGQGDAGFFTIATMMHRPTLFQAYLAAAPSVYRLAEPEREYRRFLVSEMGFSGFVYLTVGWGDQEPMMETMKFARLMQSHSLERPMHYQFEMLQQETNAGLMQATLSQGLSTLFEDTRLTTMLPYGGIEGWRSKQKALVQKYGYDPASLDIPPVSIGQDLHKLLGLPQSLLEAQARVYLADLEGKYLITSSELLSVCLYWHATGHVEAAKALARAVQPYFPKIAAFKTFASGKVPNIADPLANAYGPTIDLERGLALYLPFEEPDLTLPAAGVTLGEGKHGNAAYFSGENSYLQMDSPLLRGHQSSFSFAAWVWVDEHRNFDRLLGKATEKGNRPVWQFGMGPVGDMQWGLSTFNNSWKDYWINRPFPGKTWVHLCVVADQSQGKVRYYQNGELVGEVEELWPFPASGQPILLGCNAQKRNSFRGRLDEVYLYTRALSPAEVLAVWRGL